jgi:hypothetical protein
MNNNASILFLFEKYAENPKRKSKIQCLTKYNPYLCGWIISKNFKIY